jgi:hypothetical protein
VSSFDFEDGFILQASVKFDTYDGAYGRKVSWYSKDEDDAIILYYRPDFGEYCIFVMVNWMVLYEQCVSCSESEWTGTDGEWHDFSIRLDENGIVASRDGAIDFSVDDDSLSYFSDVGFVQLATVGCLCCFDDVSVVSLTSYACGDADASGGVDIDDVVHMINFVFSNGEPPEPLEAGDVNCSGYCDIDDIVYLVTYIFTGDPPPCASCR